MVENRDTTCETAARAGPIRPRSNYATGHALQLDLVSGSLGVLYVLE